MENSQEVDISQERLPSSSSNRTLRIILFTLLAFLLGVGLVYKVQNQPLQPTKQPFPQKLLPTTQPQPKETLTAGWKVYVNEDYGYTLKYPADWNIQSLQYKNTGRGDLAPSFEGIMFIDPKGRTNIQIRVENNYSRLDPLSYFTQYPLGETGVVGVPIGTTKEKQRKIAAKMLQSAQEVFVDNKSAFKFESVPGPIPTVQIVLFQNNLVVKFILDETSSPATKKTFSQLLSTFRFLE